jgi:hypothetical protein
MAKVRKSLEEPPLSSRSSAKSATDQFDALAEIDKMREEFQKVVKEKENEAVSLVFCAHACK